ncbi:other haspin protein kinase [Moniliophthora roreri]|nr:other haspin protein kinase [Moniliophthora roreri]
MLGTRTKQVNTYGRRGQRIVNVTEDGAVIRTRRPREPSIFDDMPPTQLAPVVSKMKNRENMAKKSKVMSPKGIKKKHSPLRIKAMSKVIAHSTLSQTSPAVKNIENTPSRTPLAVVPPNLPRSPAVSGAKISKRPRVPSTLGTPVSRTNTFVDTDIILLDEDGHTLSHERRVSASKGDVAAEEQYSDSESEAPKLRSPTKLRKRAAPVIILSDDDSSEDDEPTISPVKPPISTSTKSVPPSQPHRKTPSKAYKVRVEVVIPPPPSPLAKLIKDEPPIPIQYKDTLSPIVKPRQLTPLRPGRTQTLFTPPSPPSPLSDSELDIDLDLSGLNLGSSLREEAIPVFPEYLRPLLEECQQDKCGLHEFSAFIETFPYDNVVRSSSHSNASLHDLKFRKVGEASYSEVFGIGDVVLKVIPIRDETDASITATEEDGPFPSDAKDVLKEMIVTRAMGDVDDRFVKLLKTYVVRGRYPQVLLELWDEYLEENGSESVRPDTFGVSQVYAIIALPNGGPDLEAYKFTNASKTGWRQASSIFWQVTKALARAEQLVSFEVVHRDLHWGQILIKNLPVPQVMPMQEQRLNNVVRVRAEKTYMDDPLNGVQVTIIDLGLARMDAGDGSGGEMIHWTPFDDEVFEGEGDYQFDIYRMMREQHRSQWKSFNPLTNVMWLHYLLVKLLQSKRLKLPAAPRKGQAATHSTSQFTEKECYECLVDLEQWLQECVTKATSRAKAAAKAAGKKKSSKAPMMQATSGLSPLCAGEIVEYGIKKSWIAARTT